MYILSTNYYTSKFTSRTAQLVHTKDFWKVENEEFYFHNPIYMPIIKLVYTWITVRLNNRFILLFEF